MEKYICNITFRAENGITYYNGREYPYGDYVMLRPFERRNFSPASTSSYGSSYSEPERGYNIVDTAVDVGFKKTIEKDEIPKTLQK